MLLGCCVGVVVFVGQRVVTTFDIVVAVVVVVLVSFLELTVVDVEQPTTDIFFEPPNWVERVFQQLGFVSLPGILCGLVRGMIDATLLALLLASLLCAALV